MADDGEVFSRYEHVFSEPNDSSLDENSYTSTKTMGLVFSKATDDPIGGHSYDINYVQGDDG
jgi:hypothetical protein